MKKTSAVVLFFLFSTLIYGACGENIFLFNACIPCATGLSSNPDEIHAYLWIQGLYNELEGVGTDSTGVDLIDETCQFDGASILGPCGVCTDLCNSGDYYLLTDWSTPNYDGCPPSNPSARAVLLIYDDSGKFVLQSMSQGKGWENWDELGTMEARNLGYGDNYPETWPVPSGGIWQQSSGTYYCTIDFGTMWQRSINGGYATGDAPSTHLATQFKLYFYNGGDEYYPTNFSTSNWVAGNTYPITTTDVTIYREDIPVCSSKNLIVSRSFIYEGIEIPFVSQNYVVLLSSIWADIWDGEPCKCGAFYCPSEMVCDDVGLPCPLDFDFLYDENYPGCGVEHWFRYRPKFGNWTGKWSEPFYWTEPTDTVLNSVVDNDPNLRSGVTINFTPTVPAIRHDLYVDGVKVKENVLPGVVYNGLECNTNHNFQIKAVVNLSGGIWCDEYVSNIVSGSDNCVGVVPEIAKGTSYENALVASSDKNSFLWPSESSATGYRIYRGTHSTLPNLLSGTTNSCQKYDGALTSADISSDNPSSDPDRYFWYLVVGYNGNGEGSAGNLRTINSSGNCN